MVIKVFVKVIVRVSVKVFVKVFVKAWSSWICRNVVLEQQDRSKCPPRAAGWV